MSVENIFNNLFLSQVLGNDKNELKIFMHGLTKVWQRGSYKLAKGRWSERKGPLNFLRFGELNWLKIKMMKNVTCLNISMYSCPKSL